MKTSQSAPVERTRSLRFITKYFLMDRAVSIDCLLCTIVTTYGGHSCTFTPVSEDHPWLRCVRGRHRSPVHTTGSLRHPATPDRIAKVVAAAEVYQAWRAESTEPQARAIQAPLSEARVICYVLHHIIG